MVIQFRNGCLLSSIQNRVASIWKRMLVNFIIVSRETMNLEETMRIYCVSRETMSRFSLLVR
jgi:hypothetical protein